MDASGNREVSAAPVPSGVSTHEIPDPGTPATKGGSVTGFSTPEGSARVFRSRNPHRHRCGALAAATKATPALSLTVRKGQPARK